MKLRRATFPRREHSCARTLAERFLAASRARISNHRIDHQFQNLGHKRAGAVFLCAGRGHAAVSPQA